eukprot:365069-Chlamydomonas_euryale.AAC.7
MDHDLRKPTATGSSVPVQDGQVEREWHYMTQVSLNDQNRIKYFTHKSLHDHTKQCAMLRVAVTVVNPPHLSCVGGEGGWTGT